MKWLRAYHEARKAKCEADAAQYGADAAKSQSEVRTIKLGIEEHGRELREKREIHSDVGLDETPEMVAYWLNHFKKHKRENVLQALSELKEQRRARRRWGRV
jgi:hypothetical protein